MSFSFVFERSWQSGKVSEGLKKVNMTPILKKTEEELRNYRLVNPLIPGSGRANTPKNLLQIYKVQEGEWA